jgi:L-galactose dehydrogenase/L-glyceraldehyde 3-phosphate reductase
MDYRTLGKTGLRVSALGFGCGAVGGLMIRGAPADRERAVARAVELGINYFDTAPSYGDGQSEVNLGQVLKSLAPDVYVGTKFRIDPGDRSDVRGAITRSLEASLRRLGLERVDLLQCHNRLVTAPRDGDLPAAVLLDEVMPALARLREQGKLRFVGITSLGDTAALHRVVDAGVLDTAQVFLNLLNPSAATELPPSFPAHDFGRLLDHTRNARVGVIVVRALAAGALSGRRDRHPIAAPVVDPIGTGPDYGTDVGRAQALASLVADGHAADLVEASLRFALAWEPVSTVLLGYSNLTQLEAAAVAVSKGPLSREAIARLGELWRDLARRAPAS